MKLWHFYNDDELLTVDQQNIKERLENMSVGFWIGFSTVVILLNVIFLING